MMTVPELTDLFSRLALQLQTLDRNEDDDDDEESINLSISKLNQSLNLNEVSGVRVLETALSLMCFEAPKVFDSVIDYSVTTIASVLSSSINCEALCFGNEEFLRVGSSITRRDCEELIKACIDVLEKLKGQWTLSQMLLRAVVRVSASASCYQISFPHKLLIDRKSFDGRSTPLSRLLCYLPREFLLDNREVPLRLLFWYLDPLTLKQDISKILRDSMNRPFLCFSKEFLERVDWHEIVICLALSPIMFIETRALLHDWFLLTGLASILELLIGLISVVLDINVTPTLWGLSLELGSKLPFPGAYFPHKNQLVRTLAGPFTSEGFLHLVHATSKQVFHARKQLHLTINLSVANVVAIDHKSVWALAISFPGWFYFASILLFSQKSFEEIFCSKCTFGATKIGQMQDVEPVSATAARYIAWILSPINKADQELLADYLNKASEAWNLKQFGSGKNCKNESWYPKEHKRPKVHEDQEDHALEKEYDCLMIGLWLEEFQTSYMQYSSKTVDNPASRKAKRSHGLNLQQSCNVLFRRIPLGILVGFLSCIKEEGCELLLHYAATGRIIQCMEANSGGLKHGKWKSLSKEDSVKLPLEFSKREAIAGACAVFNLTDIVESISASLSETEERAADLICQLKLKTGKYLIKCIKRLIHLHIDEDGIQMLMDLSGRLMRWRHQGQEAVQFDKDLDDVINVLSKKLSSI